MIGFRQLYIPSTMAPDHMTIVPCKSQSGFVFHHEIIFCSWYIWGLTRILSLFIYYWTQYLISQTKKHASYSFLPSIYLATILSFTLTLDFILALPLIQEGYNVLI